MSKGRDIARYNELRERALAGDDSAMHELGLYVLNEMFRPPETNADEVAERARHAPHCAVQNNSGVCDCGVTPPISTTNANTFALRPGDTAIVFRENGIEEIFMMPLDDEEIPPATYMKAARAAYLFRSPGALRLVDALIERMRQR